MAKLSDELKARLKKERRISLDDYCDKHLHDPVLKEGWPDFYRCSVN